ncbi:hypothetical protein E2562_015552, partial [Oryza meyeriana var. granulata]
MGSPSSGTRGDAPGWPISPPEFAGRPLSVNAESLSLAFRPSQSSSAPATTSTREPHRGTHLSVAVAAVSPPEPGARSLNNLHLRSLSLNGEEDEQCQAGT